MLMYETVWCCRLDWMMVFTLSPLVGLLSSWTGFYGLFTAWKSSLGLGISKKIRNLIRWFDFQLKNFGFVSSMWTWLIVAPSVVINDNNTNINNNNNQRNNRLFPFWIKEKLQLTAMKANNTEQCATGNWVIDHSQRSEYYFYNYLPFSISLFSLIICFFHQGKDINFDKKVMPGQR